MHNNNETFSAYMQYLQDSVEALSSSRIQTGRRSKRLEKLSLALQDEDPFVRFKASKLAIVLMQDKSIYH